MPCVIRGLVRERGVAVEESAVGGDGTTEVEGGLKLSVVDPAARAEGDNRKVEGEDQILHSKVFEIGITRPSPAEVRGYSQGYVNLS